jgi:RES domain
MDQLFDGLSLINVHKDLTRNIASLMTAENLFDDLSDSPTDWETAIQVELDGKPKDFNSTSPIIHRPFEDALWDNAINYPFNHWMESRFSSGAYGVWYGADSVETSVYESAYHWYSGLLKDSGLNQIGMVSERKAYLVRCDAVLINLKEKVLAYPQITDPNDYAYCQAIGARLHHEGHPGLVSRSVRNLTGETYAILRSQVLSAPRISTYFTYELKEEGIVVMENGTKEFLTIKI